MGNNNNIHYFYRTHFRIIINLSAKFRRIFHVETHGNVCVCLLTYLLLKGIQI